MPRESMFHDKIKGLEVKYTVGSSINYVPSQFYSQSEDVTL